MKMKVVLGVTPCSLVNRYQCFGGTCRLRFQGGIISVFYVLCADDYLYCAMCDKYGGRAIGKLTALNVSMIRKSMSTEGQMAHTLDHQHHTCEEH
jgi:hypothetical protein